MRSSGRREGSLTAINSCSQSFQAFAAERKRDRARGFDVDQIAAQLLLSIQT